MVKRITPFLFYWAFHQGVGRLLRRWRELRAWWRGNRFRCRALAGESAYNVSINADSTVSCSCQDRDGAGQIGSLINQSFESIWRGEKAMSFRRKLAAGQMPIHWCSHCFDLQEVDAATAAKQVTEFALPSKGIMLENTAACNLACTSCERTTYNKTRRTRMTMLKSHTESAAQVIARLGIRYVSLLKLGEPFAGQSVTHTVEALRRHIPDVEIACSTNGMLLDTHEKREAALKMAYVGFSIDGTDSRMCQRYQAGMDFDRAYANMAALVKARGSLSLPLIVWKYVLFRWNHSTVEKAIELAREAGVDYLLITPTDSPPWGWSWRYPALSKLGQRTGMGTFVRISATDERDQYLQTVLERF